MAKAVSYLRYSSSAQGSGSTIERQQDLIDLWLADHPEIEKSHLSKIDEGKSAFKKAHLNHGLGAIIEAIDSGEIEKGDYLLIEAIDRLGRFEPLDMVDLVRKIVSSGITIVTLEDSQEYSSNSLNNEPSQLFILSGKVQQAHEYSRRLSRRVSAGNERKREKARNGEAIRRSNPIWLDGDGKRKAKESKMVLDCIELFKKGLGARAIILKLKKKHPHLETVHPTTLKRWFSNPAIKGDWVVKQGTEDEEKIDGVFQGLIDAEEFAVLQGEIRHRYKHMSPPKRYSLAQIAICENCGKSFHYRRKKYKDYTIIYANCQTYLKRGKDFCSNNKTWPYEVLQHIFYETCDAVLFEAAANMGSKDSHKLILKLQLEVSDLSERIDKIEQVIEYAKDPSSLATRRNKLIDERNSNRAQIARIERDMSSIPIEYSQQIYENYFQIHENPDARRELLIKLGYRLVIDGSQLRVINGDSEIASYTLVKRSQKNLCYLVDRTEASGGSILQAISRNGMFAATQEEMSWEQFEEKIDDYLTTAAQDKIMLSPSGDQISISDVDPEVKSENFPTHLKRPQ